MVTRTSPSPSAVPKSGASWILLALYVAVTAAASLTGSLASDPDTSAWYQALNQPPFQPPSWAFGVVWPILYLMMAYAGWRADAAAAPDRTGRLRLSYGVQLLFNAGWTIAFFALQSIVGGFVVIIELWWQSWSGCGSRARPIAWLSGCSRPTSPGLRLPLCSTGRMCCSTERSRMPAVE
jgi:tryptophan-rich sensory protein